ncbi:hypothetical protein [Chitinilyticum litopenaei]|uniref:hypothetical protein n=1 Tax=Chitinilyticum litopenaei TaxID=1121276 RepID=UPI00041E53E4|nr:hypothetical protein [Chitinilyticum litopenaei]
MQDSEDDKAQPVRINRKPVEVVAASEAHHEVYGPQPVAAWEALRGWPRSLADVLADDERATHRRLADAVVSASLAGDDAQCADYLDKLRARLQWGLDISGRAAAVALIAPPGANQFASALNLIGEAWARAHAVEPEQVSEEKKALRCALLYRARLAELQLIPHRGRKTNVGIRRLAERVRASLMQSGVELHAITIWREMVRQVEQAGGEVLIAGFCVTRDPDKDAFTSVLDSGAKGGGRADLAWSTFQASRCGKWDLLKK